MNILLAVEMSDSSEELARVLHRVPLPADSTIHIVTVLEHGMLAALAEFLHPNDEEHANRCREEASQRAEAAVDAAIAALHDLPWRFQRHVCSGHPAEEIIGMAEGLRPDLLVIGAHKHPAPHAFHLGGVAEKVVAHAHCSVLLVRPRIELEQAGSESAAAADRRWSVLLAYDSSPMAETAAAQLMQLPLQATELTIVSVLTVATTLFGKDILERLSETWQAYKTKTEADLEQLAARFRQQGAEVETKLIEGGSGPEDEILELARQCDTDLIVLGSTGRSGIERLLLGSVVSRVSRHATCSVWIARQQPS